MLVIFHDGTDKLCSGILDGINNVDNLCVHVYHNEISYFCASYYLPRVWGIGRKRILRFHRAGYLVKFYTDEVRSANQGASPKPRAMESSRAEQAFAAIPTKLEVLQSEVEKVTTRIEVLEAEIKVNRSGMDAMKNGILGEIGFVKEGMRTQIAESNSTKVGLGSEIETNKIEMRSEFNKMKGTMGTIQAKMSELSQHVQGHDSMQGTGKK